MAETNQIVRPWPVDSSGQNPACGVFAERAACAKTAAEYRKDGVMAWPIIVAWIHYASIMLMIASLLGEHLLLKPELAMTEARTIQRLDIVYGASAMIVLVTGIFRMFLEKGAAYYNQRIS